MDNKEFLFHVESNASRQERTIGRLCAIVALLVVLLLGTNGAWLYYENQFTDSMEISQDVDTGEGDATVIGIGNYGSDKADN